MAAKFPVSFEIINDEYVNKNKAPSEVAELVLGPFSRIPKLEFTNVEIGGEALLTVNLRNPTDSVQCVDVVYPKDFIERGFSLNAAEFEIPPYSKQELEIRFRPIKELQCRDTIYIKDKFRSQKSQFQLTSRAISANKKAQRKRKTWNVNKRPVVVPTQEGSERIQSLPPESDVVVTAPASNIPLVANSPGSNLNVTFPVVSVAATPISKNIDHCVKRELMSELSTVLSDDSLEEHHVQTETIKERRNFARREIDLSTTDVFTFDSVQFTSREDKENCVSSAKKRRVFDMSFSDLGFDDLTPDRKESRSILRSIDNISYNSLTPRVSVTKVAYSETISYSTTVTTIKHEPVSLQSCNINSDEPFQSDKNIGTSNQIKLEPTSPNVDLFRNPTSPNLRHNPPTNSKQAVVKPEPVTPITNRSPNVNLFRNPISPNLLLNPPTNSKQAIMKPEPVTPISNQIDSNNAFKVPLSGAIKPELFTPIPRSESMKKLPLGFTISPPKGILHSRRDLFGKGAMSSTPREKKPALQKPRPSSRGEQFDTLKVQESFWNATTSSETGEQGYTLSASSKKSIRGSTLSPKSLTAFKKNVRVHLPPKKLSRPSSAKSVDSTSSESIIVADLYTNDFKEPVYNLDIYGATTMSDPFARCAIHPLEFREKQGQQLIKWVNSVLTPPEEYSAYEAGVDVASLWKKSVTSDNVPLPPSRETVSSKFHKNEMHLLNLRKSAHLIFKSTSVSQTLYKIYSKIDVGYISVKDDMDLHSDQGARYHLVQMMMYYNPLWLRIGLEAIYGRDIPLQPRHTVIGLMHFIKHNLLSDKYISERNSYQNIHHLKTPKFKKEMNDFIVFKFLSLVFFLDIAKQKAIVPYDPCLFNKNSPIKESEGMINEFIKEFIKCVGHMKRNLASMGFVVSHKQTAIDEYNFAVQSHLDLRDGASLTRLMEIILQKKHLINKLRLPAISRLQKIHNVKLAFNALMEEGVTIVDVQSSDVVDGHREKIMSLLWQILHKFLKPRIEKGALVIQRWWKKKLLKIEITRRVQYKKEFKLHESAVKIQALWRGYYLRKNFTEIRKDLEKQKIYLKLLKEEKAAVTIQRWYRQTKHLIDCRKQYLSYLQEASARKIQIWYRNRLETRRTKLEFLKKKQACIKIQQWHRNNLEAKKQRCKYMREKSSAITIQRWCRATYAMKKQKLMYDKTRKAVITIQQSYRALVAGRKLRADYVRMKKSTIVIQRWYRATSAAKKQKMEDEAKSKAAVTIQQHYRALVLGRKQRHVYELKRKSAVAIQRWYRATMAMRNQKLEYETTRKAIITIQQHYRALAQRKKQRAEYILIRKSAIVIQCWYRATSTMRKQKLEYETKHKAIVTIQRYYRAMIQGKMQRNKYLLMKESAIIIQRRYRAMLAMKKQKLEYETVHKAVITIQRYYRAMIQGKMQRNEYLLIKESAIIIQRRYRAMLAMKKQKLEYETVHKAIVTIQRYYRATIQGKIQRNKYLLMKESAIIIQRRYRAMLAMKKQKLEYETKHKAIVTIQRYYRAMIQGKIQRNEYLLMKESAVIIQRKYRAMLAMKKQKLEYETVHKAVITIQQHYRALAQRKKQRAEYILTRNSAVVIQRWYRATSTMRKQKLEYETKHKAVVTIQRYYRAMIQGKRQRNEYLLMKESAIIIQRRYRAMLAMKKQKLEYETMCKAVITIQQHYRALAQRKKQRAEYILIRKSAVVIQRWYRAILCIKKQKLEMEIKRKAALKIWFWYWRCKAARITRNNFLLLREKVLFVQRRFRENQEIKRVYMSHVNRKSRGSTVHRSLSIDRMQEVKEAFISRITAAVKIQKWYRDIRYRRQQERMAKLIPAAEKILNWYRLVVIMRKDRKVFLYQKQAAIRIQRCYRSYRQRVAQANKPATDVKEAPRTLLQIYDHAIEVLMSHNLKTMSLHRVYVSFKNLDFVTMYSSVLCEKLAEPSMTRVYALIFHILDIGSRSDAYQSVFGHGLNVLLHLTLFSKTYDAVWKNTLQYDGINVLLRLMGKFLEKKEELFCRAATLIWLLSYSPNQLEIIRKQSELLTRLSYYSKKVAQGKKVSLKKYKPVLPKLKSTWGYTVDNKEFPSRTDAVVALHHRFEMTL